MTEQLENVDSQNDEVEVETTEEETTTEDPKTGLTDREKQFLARAKKAEGRLKEIKNSVEEPKPETIIKPNAEQGAPTMEHMALFGNGATLDEVKVAESVAKIEGISLTEAYNSDYSQAKFADMKKEIEVKNNSLPPSGGSAPAPREKTVGNMTDDEHRKFAEEKLAGATNT